MHELDDTARTQIPEALRPRYDAIVRLIDTFCQQHLTEEYAESSRRLAAALCSEQPSPVTRGRPDSWACGIVYAIGSVNFLFDKSQTPHLKASELCALFGVSTATGGNKATAIRNMFEMSPLDIDWGLPNRRADNPLAWLITVNGLPMDARHAPRAIQEEALRLGLIPSLPDPDR